MKEPHELIDNVHNAASFLRFVEALMNDRKAVEGKQVDESGFAGDWANNDIEGFLEAALAWAEDSDFEDESDIHSTSELWKRFATFLYSGKAYE